MSNHLSVQGVVVTPPEVCGAHTAFILQTEDQQYCVVRIDPAWQKRDMVFLREGQMVLVSGVRMDEADEIYAQRIFILDHFS